jgi:cytochrome c553
MKGSAGVAIGALLLAASALAAAPRYADLRRIEPIHGDAVAGLKKATACFACHGAAGASVAPTFPRLAGQRADYLYHRLVSFKRADPKDTYYSVSPMKPIATSLSDTDMRDLATYFSSQTPPQTATYPAAPSKGEALFLAGDHDNGTHPVRDATAPMPGVPRSAPVNMQPIHRCAGNTRRISSHGSRVFTRTCRMTPPTTSSWVPSRRPSTMSRFKPSRRGSVHSHQRGACDVRLPSIEQYIFLQPEDHDNAKDIFAACARRECTESLPLCDRAGLGNSNCGGSHACPLIE